MKPICASACLNFSLPTSNVGQATGSRSNDIDACVSVGEYSSPISDNYMGCLGVGASISASAGAVWWFMKVQNPGNIVLQLQDVDFMVWGPNLNEALALCGRHRAHADCSFDIQATETININNMQTGDIYVLYVLNYAGVNQNASLIKTGGTATLDCSIINDCLVRNITNISTTACTPATNTYSASMRVSFEYPPTPPTTLIVNGQSFTVTATDVSNGYKDITLTNLPADGAPVNVLAYFASDISCKNTLVNAWTAPASCDPCPANPGNW